jgi:two-component sensor histidine kinase
MLLAELQHRVKNNFAAISAMLQLQLRQSQGPARAALDLVRTRIEALSLANQQLLEGRTVGPIDLARYLGSLADNLRTFNDLSTHRIELDLVVVPCRVPAAVAGSLGLLINEFVTNSAKHAFPGNRPGHIRIELQSSAAEFVVHLTDDGVGLPARAHESPGMGLRLMQSLAHQVEGELLWIEEQVGSHVVVRVPYRSD